MEVYKTIVPKKAPVKEYAVKNSKGEITGVYTKDMIQTIKQTVCKGATDSELKLFLNIASSSGLNPFRKEIWFVKVRTGDNMIMTSRDGYLKIAQKDPNFLKVQSMGVHENDKFETTMVNGEITEVKHSFGSDRGKLIGAYAFLKSRDGTQDLYNYSELKPYYKGNNVWKHYTEAMIRKVAEVDVLKRFGGISGLVTYEEMGYQPKGVEYQYQEPDEIIKKIETKEEENNTVTVEMDDNSDSTEYNEE